MSGLLPPSFLSECTGYQLLVLTRTSKGSVSELEFGRAYHSLPICAALGFVLSVSSIVHGFAFVFAAFQE